MLKVEQRFIKNYLLLSHITLCFVVIRSQRLKLTLLKFTLCVKLWAYDQIFSLFLNRNSVRRRIFLLAYRLLLNKSPTHENLDSTGNTAGDIILTLKSVVSAMTGHEVLKCDLDIF